LYVSESFEGSNDHEEGGSRAGVLGWLGVWLTVANGELFSCGLSVMFSAAKKSTIFRGV
jgi:hypothetical protein